MTSTRSSHLEELERLRPEVERLLRRCLAGRNADIENLAGEVILAAIEGLDSFRGEAKLKTWLYRIAWHKAADWRRRRSRQNKPLEDADAMPAAGPSPSSVADRRSLLRRVSEAIDMMSEEERGVVLLKQEDFSDEQIAQMLDIPYDKVRWLRNKALEKLRDLVARLGLAA